MNQALYKPDEYVLLVSTFIVRHNGTRTSTAPIHFDPRYQFGIVITNEDANDTLVKFNIRCIDAGVPVRNPTDEELETLPIYEITSSLFWDPSRKLLAKNEMATQQVTLCQY